MLSWFTPISLSHSQLSNTFLPSPLCCHGNMLAYSLFFQALTSLGEGQKQSDYHHIFFVCCITVAHLYFGYTYILCLTFLSFWPNNSLFMDYQKVMNIPWCQVTKCLLNQQQQNHWRTSIGLSRFQNHQPQDTINRELNSKKGKYETSGI